MDRFEWDELLLYDTEVMIMKLQVTKLYDGNTKTVFEGGETVLTTHRLFWQKSVDTQSLSLPLHHVIFVEHEEGNWFYGTPKAVLHLTAAAAVKKPGPTQASQHSHVKVGTRDGNLSQFIEKLNGAIQEKAWHKVTSFISKGPVFRSGIMGIEKSIIKKQIETDQTIDKALEDLKQLMHMAKDVVSLTRSISNKIKDKQDISHDETIQFKSYLLSMGIDDPITRDMYKSESTYHKELAVQISTIVSQPIKESGGMMSLPDVYCRVNRARGLNLLSPEDIINSCKLMESLDLPILLRGFDSGLLVLQDKSQNDDVVNNETKELVEAEESLNAEELSKILSITMLLARERLIAAEKCGHICRDETIEGLRFYINKFVSI